MRFIACDAARRCLHELFDPRHDVVDLEVGRVDLLRVGGRLHPYGVTLVAQPKIGRERVATDVRALGLAASCARARVGVEVDLDLGIRRDDRADVPSLDDDVAVVAELTLALAHHLAHGRVVGDNGDLPVDVRLRESRR